MVLTFEAMKDGGGGGGGGGGGNNGLWEGVEVNCFEVESNQELDGDGTFNASVNGVTVCANSDTDFTCLRGGCDVGDERAGEKLVFSTELASEDNCADEENDKEETLCPGGSDNPEAVIGEMDGEEDVLLE